MWMIIGEVVPDDDQVHAVVRAGAVLVLRQRRAVRLDHGERNGRRHAGLHRRRGPEAAEVVRPRRADGDGRAGRRAAAAAGGGEEPATKRPPRRQAGTVTPMRTVSAAVSLRLRWCRRRSESALSTTRRQVRCTSPAPPRRCGRASASTSSCSRTDASSSSPRASASAIRSSVSATSYARLPRAHLDGRPDRRRPVRPHRRAARHVLRHLGRAALRGASRRLPRPRLRIRQRDAARRRSAPARPSRPRRDRARGRRLRPAAPELRLPAHRLTRSRRPRRAVQEQVRDHERGAAGGEREQRREETEPDHATGLPPSRCA